MPETAIVQDSRAYKLLQHIHIGDDGTRTGRGYGGYGNRFRLG